MFKCELIPGLTPQEKKRLSKVISVAMDLGITTLRIIHKGVEYKIHIHSGNFYEEDAPDYIKRRIVKIGK